MGSWASNSVNWMERGQGVEGDELTWGLLTLRCLWNRQVALFSLTGKSYSTACVELEVIYRPGRNTQYLRCP